MVSRAPGLPRLVRILVVDDNQDMVTTLTALRILEEVKPDALIVDIAMPGMTGWEVARNVRQSGTGQRAMLIAISGEYSERTNKLLIDKGGFDYFLSKPCDPNVVLNLLRPLKSARPSSARVADEPR
jgi:CheY-like chemotaxis protein